MDMDLVLEQEKKYNTGNYIALSKWKQDHPMHMDSEMFGINEYPKFDDGNGDYKLIRKKHEEVLNAWLLNNDVKIEFNAMIEWLSLDGCSFIDGYNEGFDYRLKPKEVEKTLEDLKKEEFTEFGFEVPDFECEILKEVKGTETQFVGYIKLGDLAEPVCWNTDGRCYGTFDDDFDNSTKEYNLIPIKKPWYKNEDCVGKLAIAEGGCMVIIQRSYFEKGYAMTAEYSSCPLKFLRLATNEEIDSLKTKG